MRLAYGLAALATCALPFSAHAAPTIVAANGSYGAGSPTSARGNFASLTPGNYLITLDLSAPANNLSGEVFYFEHQLFIFEQPGGGYNDQTNEYYMPFSLTQVSPTKYQTSLYTFPYRALYGHSIVQSMSYDSFFGFTSQFTSQSSGSFTLSYTATPEPATWAMMVLGFGAIGAASRKRQRVAVSYT